MKYLRYMILLFMIVLLIMITLLSVEPFFEGTTPSYLLLLRESNEKMLTEFIDLKSQQMSFDLSNPADKELFMKNNSKVIEDIGGETIFNNIFSRKSTGPPCTLNPPNNADVAGYLSKADTSASYTTWESSVNGYTDISLNTTGIAPTLSSPTLIAGSSVFIGKSVDLAYSTPSLFTPWSCSTGCTMSYSKNIPPELIASANVRAAGQINSDITAYNNRKITSNGNTTICQGGTYYNKLGGGTTCTDYEFPKDRLKTLQTNIITYIKSYIKDPPQQLTNPGFSCMSTVPYTPTYLSTTQKIPTTDTAPQPNVYYNGILLGRTMGTDGLKYRVIANEVGEDHVSRFRMLQTKK
jgi:hypothetical protein